MADDPAGRPAHTLVPPLLTSLMSGALDPGYAHAAARSPGRPPARGRSARALAYLLAAAVLAGLVFGVAARTQQLNAPTGERTHAALIADIDRAQQRVATLSASAAGLTGELRDRQAVLGANGALARAESLQRQAGDTPVSGPGLQMVLGQSGAGQILDQDIQLLVNGLWAAGARGVAIGGVRLDAASAIRHAGGAILIDNRPVFWPVTVQAIGDPATLHVRFVQTPGFARFAALSSAYGVQFDIQAEPDITLPAAAPQDLRYALPYTPSAAPPTTAELAPTPESTR